jgi:hypothetical protein
MINDSPRSAPAASSAISNTATAPLRLTELHRFTNPNEATASLALRDGKPAALDFYLDHGRVHVGDVATTTEDMFNVWFSDRTAGLDTIMIAPALHRSPNSTAVPGGVQLTKAYDSGSWAFWRRRS